MTAMLSFLEDSVAPVLLTLFNHSLTAGWLVLAVLLLRLALRWTPRWVPVALWALVGVRLLLLVSLPSPTSLVPNSQPLSPGYFSGTEPLVQSGIPAVDAAINPLFPVQSTQTTPPTLSEPVAASTVSLTGWLTLIWLLGLAAMLVYAVVSYLRVGRQVREAMHLRENLWICDRIRSPFILGVVRPKIYLPSYLSDTDSEYVIAHERTHLRRGDHLWKPLGFLLLAVYWYNPLLWVAYILLCRDIELACDERVLNALGEEGKKPYTTALINCSATRRRVTACPLAFGEVGVKERVKRALSYKKPAFWLVLVGAVACCVAAVCLLTDPLTKSTLKELEDFGLEQTAKDTVQMMQGEEGTFSPVQYWSIEQLDDLLALSISDSPISEERHTTCAGVCAYTLVLQTQADTPLSIHSYISGTYICFNADFTTVWAVRGKNDESVQASRGYRVLEPEKARELYQQFLPAIESDPLQQNGTVYFYTAPTEEDVKPTVRNTAGMPSGTLQNFIGNLSQLTWIADAVLDRLPFRFDGQIFYDGRWIFFGYADAVLYCQEHVAVLSAADMEALLYCDNMASAILPEENTPYAKFLKTYPDKDATFRLLDLDKDKVDELLIQYDCTLYVYQTDKDGEVVLVDSHDFVTATLRFLRANRSAYHGLVSCVTSGGLDWYTYITLANGKLQLDPIVEADFSGVLSADLQTPGTLRKHTEDEEWISAVLKADSNNQYQPFLSVSFYESLNTTETAETFAIDTPYFILHIPTQWKGLYTGGTVDVSANNPRHYWIGFTEPISEADGYGGFLVSYSCYEGNFMHYGPHAVVAVLQVDGRLYHVSKTRSTDVQWSPAGEKNYLTMSDSVDQVRIEVKPAYRIQNGDTTGDAQYKNIPFSEEQAYAVAHVGYQETTDLAWYREAYGLPDDLPTYTISDGDYYLVIPWYAGMTLYLHRQDDTASCTLVDTVENCTPFLLQCNTSDIMPDAMVELVYNGEPMLFSPEIPLSGAPADFGVRGLNLNEVRKNGRLVVTETADGSRALQVYDGSRLVQTIPYEEGAARTVQPYYLQYGMLDTGPLLLLPANSPARGVQFRAYYRDNATGQYTELKGIRSITNPVFDTATKTIFGKSTGDKTTSYGIWSMQTGELRAVSGLSWSPDQDVYYASGVAEGATVRITESVDGVQREYIVPSDPQFPYEPDGNSPEMRELCEDGSYWDIDSPKWEAYFFALQNG